MDNMIAYCGLVCSDCQAYVATQANDPAALERVAAEWREAVMEGSAAREDGACVAAGAGTEPRALLIG